MKNIQEIFDRLQERKTQLKIIKRKAKEECAANSEWQTATETKEKAKARVKDLERTIIGQKAQDRIAELALAVRQDQQMLSDIALTAIMKGESVRLKDGDRRKEFEPVFKVTFRQLKLNL